MNDLQDAERVLDALSEMDDLYSWEQDNVSNHVNGNIMISINPVCTYIKITESMTTTESTDITNYGTAQMQRPTRKYFASMLAITIHSLSTRAHL